ncbi:unnamed protein product, partial [Rotaria socialis]
HIYEHLLSK